MPKTLIFLSLRTKVEIFQVLDLIHTMIFLLQSRSLRGRVARFWRRGIFRSHWQGCFVDSAGAFLWPAACLDIGVMLDGVAGQLERYMDLLSTREKLVASNIANADTPGYHTRDIDFQHEFLRASGLVPQPLEVSGLSVKNDGNNVSLDREARSLSETALRFSAASQLMRTQIRVLRSAIEEGRNG